jgi:hypothetical protein
MAKRVRRHRIPVYRVHLEVADVSGNRSLPVDVDLPDTRRHAASESIMSVDNPYAGIVALEAIEREEIRLSLNAKRDVSFH